jgi:hypothetical protein
MVATLEPRPSSSLAASRASLRCRRKGRLQGFVRDHGIGAGDHRHAARRVTESPRHGLKRNARHRHAGSTRPPQIMRAGASLTVFAPEFRPLQNPPPCGLIRRHGAVALNGRKDPRARLGNRLPASLQNVQRRGDIGERHDVPTASPLHHAGRNPPGGIRPRQRQVIPSHRAHRAHALQGEQADAEQVTPDRQVCLHRGIEPPPLRIGQRPRAGLLRRPRQPLRAVANRRIRGAPQPSGRSEGIEVPAQLK